MAKVTYNLTREQAEHDAMCSATLLRYQVCDLRKYHDLTWDEIGKAVGLPGYVCKVIAGETAGRRPTPDRQSGR
jgi:hypothetical protein